MFIWTFYKTLFFTRVPTLDKENLNEFKEGTFIKKCFLEAKKTHPDILCGGHRNPYQLENAIKSGGTVFLHISLGLNYK